MVAGRWEPYLPLQPYFNALYIFPQGWSKRNTLEKETCSSAAKEHGIGSAENTYLAWKPETSDFGRQDCRIFM